MTKSRKPGTAPRLTINITEQQWNKAVRSASGGCLIADAIKTQFPEMSSVTVDMATVRATDRERGERYTWLTPGSAQHLLLSYDQGWKQSTDQIQLRDAVKITRMFTSNVKTRVRQERRAVLEAKESTGEPLTRRESQSLAKIRATDQLRPEPLPTAAGPVREVRGLRAGNATVVGGRGLPKTQADKHPNLLAGRDRHFGAKLSQPGLAFQEAVEAAVAQHLASAGEADGGATDPSPHPQSES